MRLLSVEVNNFRSIKGIKIEFNEETNSLFALVGKNDSGKSNILQAIDLILRGEKSPFFVELFGTLSDGGVGKSYKTIPPDKRISFGRLNQEVTISCVLIENIEDIKTRYFKGSSWTQLIHENLLKVKPDPNGNVPIEISWRFEIENENSIIINGRTLKIGSSYILGPINGIDHYEALGLDDSNQWKVIQIMAPLVLSGGKFLFETIFKDILDSVAMISGDRSFSSKEGLQLLSDIEEHQSSSAGLDRDYVKQIEKNVKKLGISVENLHVRRKGKGGELELYLESIPHTQLGLGTCSRALICATLINSEKKFILLEEPEIHLHPEAQRILMELLVELSKTKQIILSTHSPVVAGELNNIILVSKESGSTNIRTGNDIDFFSEIANQLGIKPSDQLVGFKACVFVEGKSDVEVWRIIGQKFKESGNLAANFDDMKIGFIPYGGQMLRYWVDINLISQLSQKSITILDSDIKSEGQQILKSKIKIKNDIEEKGQLCIILRKREIENYLHRSVIEEKARIDSKLKPQIRDYDDIKGQLGENTYKLFEKMTAEQILESDKYTDMGIEKHELLEIARQIFEIAK